MQGAIERCEQFRAHPKTFCKQWTFDQLDALFISNGE